MPVSDYSPPIVLLGYYIQKHEAGSPAEREKWSQELYDRYNAGVVAACAPVTPVLDPTPEQRSIMAIIALHAPGNSEEQAKKAVAVWVEYRGL